MHGHGGRLPATCCPPQHAVTQLLQMDFAALTCDLSISVISNAAGPETRYLAMTGTPFRTDKQDIQHVRCSLIWPRVAKGRMILRHDVQAAIVDSIKRQQGGSGCKLHVEMECVPAGGAGGTARRGPSQQYARPQLRSKYPPHIWPAWPLQDLALKPFMLMDALAMPEEERSVKDLCFLELEATPEQARALPLLERLLSLLWLSDFLSNLPCPFCREFMPTDSSTSPAALRAPSLVILRLGPPPPPLCVQRERLGKKKEKETPGASRVALVADEEVILSLLRATADLLLTMRSERSCEPQPHKALGFVANNMQAIRIMRIAAKHKVRCGLLPASTGICLPPPLPVSRRPT